ncbi:MAG TPA: hypothetical protein VJN93_14345 [Candidatus Acidoferrum sp.]|nr:hypothetical protein [Candidatus Acidoferrum sp.]
MTQVKDIHREAMSLSDRAIEARLNGDATAAERYFRQAYDLEQRAAMNAVAQSSPEPTRSVLLRSAASIALDCNLLPEAERLVCIALAGSPPTEIGEELRDLYEQVNFQRHLELRGISLSDDEIQMSIAGKGVGYGFAPTEAFIERVEKTENLLYRTAERTQNLPYRDKGRRDKTLRDKLGLYISVPRAASFAVTFKLGNTEQPSLPGISLGEQVIDEVLECLEIYGRGEQDKLQKRIKEPAYYRNFIGLADGIAPDGKELSIVGFTALRHNRARKVALTSKKTLSQYLEKTESIRIEEPSKARAVRVLGFLKFADSRRKNKDEIQIIDSGGVSHTIVVPPGMMSDIVKPLWDSYVLVIGVQSENKISLEEIHPADQSESHM